MIRERVGRLTTGLGVTALVGAACTFAPAPDEDPAPVSAERVVAGSNGGEAYERLPAGLDPRTIPPPSFARMEGYFPNTKLLTQDGKEVRFYEDLVKGKIVLINFMYTNCDGI